MDSVFHHRCSLKLSSKFELKIESAFKNNAPGKVTVEWDNFKHMVESTNKLIFRLSTALMTMLYCSVDNECDNLKHQLLDLFKSTLSDFALCGFDGDKIDNEFGRFDNMMVFLTKLVKKRFVTSKHDSVIESYGMTAFLGSCNVVFTHIYNWVIHTVEIKANGLERWRKMELKWKNV